MVVVAIIAVVVAIVVIAILLDAEANVEKKVAV